MTKRNRLIATSIAAIVLVAALVVWHVHMFRSSLMSFRDQGQELGNRVAQTAAVLESGNGTAVVSAVAELNTYPEALTRLSQERQQVVDSATFIQSFLVRPDDEWVDSLKQSLVSAFLQLPDAAPRAMRDLATSLSSEANSSSSPQQIRKAVAEFSANRKALIESCSRSEALARDFDVTGLNIQSAVVAEKEPAELAKWIDRAADAEERALAQLQRAANVASEAAGEARRMDPDASSSDIRQVLAQWAQAQSEVQDTTKILNIGRVPRNRQALVSAILEPPTSKMAALSRDIDRQYNQTARTYQEALREESTVVGRLFRGARRGARQASSQLQRLGAEAQSLMETKSAELASAADAGMSRAIVAAGTAIGEGVRAYEESRKPPLQRFLESKEGQMLILGAGGLLIVVMFVAALIARK